MVKASFRSQNSKQVAYMQRGLVQETKRQCRGSLRFSGFPSVGSWSNWFRTSLSCKPRSLIWISLQSDGSETISSVSSFGYWIVDEYSEVFVPKWPSTFSITIARCILEIAPRCNAHSRTCSRLPTFISMRHWGGIWLRNENWGIRYVESMRAQP
jgi:hypothetical protein